MIDKTLINEFANILGDIEIAINLDSYNSVKESYKLVKNELINWIKYYYLNNNLDIVTSKKSLELHNILDDIKEQILFNKEINDEKLLSDNILIRYEVIIKMINDKNH